MKEITKGIIALAIIVVVSGAIYGYEIIEESYLEEGDFAEIYYIGYFENGSVFASSFEENVSYDTPFNPKLYNLTPLKIYFGENVPTNFPDDWSYGDIGDIKGSKLPEIKGLYEEMKGMKKGEEKIIELPPEKAYGKKVEVGTVFRSNILFYGFFNQTLKIINMTNDSVDLQWEVEVNDTLTLFPFWENASVVTKINETKAWITTTPPPDKLNVTYYSFWPNATRVEWNESIIKFIHSPEIGTTFYDYGVEYEVSNITEDKIICTPVEGGSNKTYDRVDTVNRTVEIDRIYSSFPLGYFSFLFDNDLRNAGYSFHELAGKKVIFRVKLLRIYKVS
ncbi:MAG: FKBP-type peptidyl-prolyl cis-trans isomerase [Thermoplasmata archaeon]|nr:MAG: FKBP-type peptidyl-prolyl cis-trans isomerase [Thermoplasmata archaeon]